jgi:hypothetical protein
MKILLNSVMEKIMHLYCVKKVIVFGKAPDPPEDPVPDPEPGPDDQPNRPGH